MSKENEKIVRKISALMEKAESCRTTGSIIEAEIFAQKVQELLIKHKISEMDIESSKKKPGEIVDHIYMPNEYGRKLKKSFDMWEVTLMRLICEDMSCRSFVYGSTNMFMICGRMMDVSAVVRVFNSLRDAIELECDKSHGVQYRAAMKTDSRHLLKDYKKSFKNGAVEGVGHKLKERRMQLEEQFKDSWSIVLSAQKKVDEHVNEFLDVGKVNRKTKRDNESALMAGYEFGRSVGDKKIQTQNGETK